MSYPLPRAIAAAAVLTAAAHSTAQSQAWIRHLGTSGEDFTYAAASDGAGGVFLGGYTAGELAGPNLGEQDSWLAHYDAAGTQLWIRQFGTPFADAVLEAIPDGAGGFFAAGIVGGAVGSLESWDVWLARYDSAGTQLWIRQFGSISYDDATGLASDGAGGVYISGNTFDQISTDPSAGDLDPWIARYTGTGDRMWIHQFGTPAEDSTAVASPDGSGGVYIAGNTAGSLGGPFQGDDDAWVARFDSGGHRLWTRQLGHEYLDEIDGAAPDGAGGVYVTGNTIGSIGTDPSAGGEDIWLARYRADGSLAWIHQFGTPADEDCWLAVADGLGGVYIGGYTSGALVPPSLQEDVFLARFDGDGNRTWIHQFGSPAGDWAEIGAPDGSGGLFVAGNTTGDLGGPNQGMNDIWLARFRGPCYANCDGSTNPPILNVLDFGCFLNKFAAADPYANCDGSTNPPVLNVLDFGCFLNRFAAGCP